MRFSQIIEADGSAIVQQCALCGGEIYRGETYYHISGEAVCTACLGDYAKKVFAPFITKGGEQ